MAKYEVLKAFRDIHTNDVYKEKSEIELSEERAEEVHENLKEKGIFIELIPEEDKFDREAAKEKLKDLGVEFSGNAKNETLKKLLEENEKQVEQDNPEGNGQEDENQVEEGE